MSGYHHRAAAGYSLSDRALKDSTMKTVIRQAQKAAFRKAYAEAADTAFALLLSIPICVMHEKYGWSDEELMELAEILTDEYQKFSDGDMTLDQYQDLVFRLTGMKFERNPEC